MERIENSKDDKVEEVTTADQEKNLHEIETLLQGHLDTSKTDLVKLLDLLQKTIFLILEKIGKVS